MTIMPKNLPARAIVSALLFLPCAGWAQSIFGTNLIVNGGAESGAGEGRDVIVPSIPGWTSKGANVITYASGYGIQISDIVPVGPGKNYFSNGDTSSSMTQTVSLSAGATVIDAGMATYDASGYFGGYSNYDDNATMVIAFLNASGATLSSFSVGGVKSADRADTGLYLRRQIGAVPVGTRSATVTVNFVMTTSSTNNAGADNLSLIVNSPATLPVLYGSNVIVNGNAESCVQQTSDMDFSTDMPGWVRTAEFTADVYGGSDADLTLTSPAPPDAGKLYFYGGSSNPASMGYQDIDISQGATQIDAGGVTYALSAWIGGYSSQNDNTVLTVQFLNWSGTVLGTATLGPVLSADRNGVSALQQRMANGTVPTGTRMVHVQMQMTRTDGSDNDGMADSLSLILTNHVGVPTISANGVATAAAFGGSKTIAPGTWIEIYGQNLAPDARQWAGADFVGTNAPTSLDGVKVTIGGQPAFVGYISAGQVNVQAPSGLASGQQPVVVSTTAGGSSAAYPVTVAATQPGVLAPATFMVSGKQYVAALFSDGVTFALPPNTLPGVPSRYAKPGDTITVYGLGFGPATPNTPPGQVTPPQSNMLTTPLTVSFSGTAGTLSYEGLAPSLVGVYQFNIVVPNVANNDFEPLTFTFGGAPIAQTVYTAIHD
jgi:uncharacterized protein (TIGR03437 family)